MDKQTDKQTEKLYHNPMAHASRVNDITCDKIFMIYGTLYCSPFKLLGALLGAGCACWVPSRQKRDSYDYYRDQLRAKCTFTYSIQSPSFEQDHEDQVYCEESTTKW